MEADVHEAAHSWGVLHVVLAVPAGAATWCIGPNLGFDILSAKGSSTSVVSVPGGGELVTAGVRPGLRIGAWDPALRNEWFSDVSLLVVSGTGSTSYTTAFTLNHAYAFRSGSAPYFTVGVGVMKPVKRAAPAWAGRS